VTISFSYRISSHSTALSSLLLSLIFMEIQVKYFCVKCILKTYAYSPSKSFNEHSISNLVNTQIYMCRMQRIRQKKITQTHHNDVENDSRNRKICSHQKRHTFFLSWLCTPIGPRPHGWGFDIILKTHHPQ
jgi:hypothetical protein